MTLRSLAPEASASAIPPLAHLGSIRAQKVYPKSGSLATALDRLIKIS
jgi:hypothetical protein